MKWLLIILASYNGTAVQSGPWFEDLESCQRAADYTMGPLSKNISLRGSISAGCVQGAPAVFPLAVVNVHPTRTIEHQTDRVKIDVNVRQK